MVSAISGYILVRHLDVDLPVLDRYRIGFGRDDRRQAGDLAGPDVEARTMPRAFDRHVPEIPLAERVILVGTRVADRIKAVVFSVDQADRLAITLHPHHRLLGQFGRLRHTLLGHATQCGRPVPAPPRRAPGALECGPAPPTGIPGPASARRPDGGFPDSPGRRGVPGPPDRRSRHGCS